MKREKYSDIINEHKKVWKKFGQYYTYKKKNISAIIVLKILAIPLSLITPIFYKVLVDNVMLEKKISLLPIVIIGYLITFAFQSVLSGLSLKYSNAMTHLYTFKLRSDLWNKLVKKQCTYYEHVGPADIKRIIDNDPNETGGMILTHYIEYIFSLINILIYSIAMFVINWKLAILAFAITPVLMYLGLFIGSGNRRINEQIRDIENKYYTWQYDIFAKWREVKALNMEELTEKTFERYRKKIGRYAHVRNDIYDFLQQEYWVLKKELFIKVLLYVFGLYFILNGQMVIGSLLVFMNYYATSVDLFEGIDSKNNKFRSLQININRLTELLEAEDVVNGNVPFENFKSLIKFHNVGFQYNERLGTVLKNINLTINKGEHIAIIGESGCGKSTILKLLLGLYSPTSGDISIDGVSVSDYKTSSYYRRIAVVMQDNLLFNMTIKENLLLANQDASDIDISNACRRAKILDFIEEQTDGFDTIIGERGIKLSGGQKQRLAVARVLLINPHIIVFDEATSALDYDTEKHLKYEMDMLFADKTTITVAHRFSTIATAEKVIVVKDGTIVGIGTHDQLRRENDEYIRLFKEREFA